MEPKKKKTKGPENLYFKSGAYLELSRTSMMEGFCENT